MDQEWLNELLWKNTPEWRKNQLREEQNAPDFGDYSKSFIAESSRVRAFELCRKIKDAQELTVLSKLHFL